MYRQAEHPMMVRQESGVRAPRHAGRDRSFYRDQESVFSRARRGGVSLPARPGREVGAGTEGCRGGGGAPGYLHTRRLGGEARSHASYKGGLQRCGLQKSEFQSGTHRDPSQNVPGLQRQCGKPVPCELAMATAVLPHPAVTGAAGAKAIIANAAAQARDSANIPRCTVGIIRMRMLLISLS